MELRQLAMPEGNIFSALHDIFEKAMEKLPDDMRNHDLLDHWLFSDHGATKIFLVDGTPSVLIIGSLQEGLSASVLMLNPAAAEPGQIRRELLEIMAVWKLKRLTAEVPGPVKDVQQVLKEVGFRREGHLRRATFWNGRLCGIDIYGLYKERPPRRSNAQRAADSSSDRTQSAPVGGAALGDLETQPPEPAVEHEPAPAA